MGSQQEHLDPILMELKKSLLTKTVEDFSQGVDGVLRYQGRLCLLDVDGFRAKILEETRSLQYSIHSRSTKMYRDL